MNFLWLSGLLMTAVISFSAGYSLVHENEHQEITSLQASLENANLQINSVYREAEKKAVSAKGEAAMLNNKLEQANKDKNSDSNVAIQLHVTDDKPCLKPRRLK